MKKPKLGTSMKSRHAIAKLPPRFRGQVVTKENNRGETTKDKSLIPSLVAVGAQLPPGSAGIIGGLGTLNKAPGSMPIGVEMNNRIPTSVDVMMPPLGGSPLIRKGKSFSE